MQNPEQKRLRTIRDSQIVEFHKLRPEMSLRGLEKHFKDEFGKKYHVTYKRIAQIIRK